MQLPNRQTINEFAGWCSKIASALSNCAVLILLSVHLSTPAEAQGRFEGDLVLKALADGRTMELVQPFNYVDTQGVEWPVPARTRVDGASIPSVFWSIIGAPYTGKYRDASVIHDYYCQTHSRHWKAVHRVFHDGMLTQGVDPIQARIMYSAVYRFGPRWDYDADACFCKGCPACANPKIRKIASYQSNYSERDFEALKRKAMDSRTTLGELEDLADYQVNSEVFSR